LRLDISQSTSSRIILALLREAEFYPMLVILSSNLHLKRTLRRLKKPSQG
jgi:hypothetical protein